VRKLPRAGVSFFGHRPASPPYRAPERRGTGPF
jgi:hypothetical protein